jgi:MFS transporter, YNFM family, putative membrane transport protein
MALTFHAARRTTLWVAHNRAAAQADAVPRSAWVALPLGTAAVFANMYSTQAILPQLGRAFHQPPAMAGLTVSLLVLAVAFGALVAGPLSDRLGRKPVMLGVSALLVIPTALCALAPNFGTLLAGRTLQGLLMPGLTSVAVVYIAELFPPNRRGTAMGIYVGGQVLGGLLARGASATLADRLGWRPALLFFAFTTALGALAIARYFPRAPRTLQAERASLLAGLRMHLGNRRLLSICVAGFSLFFGFVGIFTYLPYELTGAPWHVPPGALGLVYLVWITGLCSPPAGSLAGRHDPRRMLVLSLILPCLGIALLCVPRLPVLVLGLLVLTLGQFTAMPAINLLVSTAGRQARGAASALYLCCYYFGGSAGAVIPGILWTRYGWHGVLACCGTLATLALAVAARLAITTPNPR